MRLPFKLTPLRAAIGLVLALLFAILILYRLPSGDYILLPDVAHPVGPLVSVKGGKASKTGGTIYFVDVFERQAREIEWMFPWLHSHATLVPIGQVVPPGSTAKAVLQAEQCEMATSQRIAAAVAERQLHLPVVTPHDGVLVDNVFSNVPAAAKVSPADVIVAADGTPTPTPAALQAALGRVKPGRFVTLRISRCARTLVERVKTIGDPQAPGRALIGVEVEQGSQRITLPVKVSIDAGDIGGPSAGLAFTLEVMQQLGANVTHGHDVAATGQILLNGDVAPIGGVKQKTWGVREAGADVFLVPVGDNNVKDARANAGPNLKIIPVTSLQQALHALATLPPAK